MKRGNNVGQSVTTMLNNITNDLRAAFDSIQGLNQVPVGITVQARLKPVLLEHFFRVQDVPDPSMMVLSGVRVYWVDNQSEPIRVYYDQEQLKLWLIEQEQTKANDQQLTET